MSTTAPVSYYRPSRLARRFWPLTSYLVTNLTVAFLWVLFRVLNRTTVRGREHVGDERNTLLIANHQSMIDSFLIGLAVFFPKSLLKPHLMPWNPAAVENFFRGWLLGWLSYNWRCIPVREGRRDPRALRRLSEVLPKGVMILYPEGTRTRDGSVGPGKPGAGIVARTTGARVIPVAIDGMRDVLPIGRSLPRIGKRIYVVYGPPLESPAMAGDSPTREEAQQLVDRALVAIREQLATVRAEVAARRAR
ncbi:MAG: 1-acyl-sn-glycerol-3-phosphate acyltransferase [Gemmatimonadota bacterium]|nr:1-acyl-sn-glycerol-3-phosphate acyltransferase [Gemmatimonadota bacterium]MDH5198606.1 1-acyl-sn-glycerol-3-phosphate acyltransferase [Gemmatimonadota bacterium]